MDVSLEYIKMCENTKELQRVHDTKGVSLKGSWYLFDKTIYVNDGASLIVVGHKVVWLPRQDQLQEMVANGKPYWKVLQDFLFFFSANLEIQAQAAIKEWTGEQLWLAFVMFTKYSKTWNRTGWVKV